MGRAKPNPEWVLELGNALQASLDVHEVLGIFHRCVGRVIPHDGIEFLDSGGKHACRIGAESAHASTHDMVLDGEALGRVTLYRARRFGARERAALEDALQRLLHPLHNAILYQEAIPPAALDPLTGINNRTSLDTHLEREMGLAKRHRTEFALLMIDADGFKAVNDRHGHLVGDCVLRHLAGVVGECVRESDIVFRYGGEEFVVMLRNTSLEGAEGLAERIRTAVSAMRCMCHGVEARITVSVGVAILAPGDDRNRLLARADDALYRSKREGRNRVSSSRTETPVQ